jgi:hypothetical protein
VTSHIVAQSSADSGAAVLAVLLALAVVGLQIYLIYAIIATRQDVKVIRQILQGGPAPHSAGDRSAALTAAGPRSEDLDRLREAADLRQGGILTEDEFARVKEGMLVGWTLGGRVPTFPSQAATSQAAQSTWGSQYAVIIHDLGSADSARVAKIIRSHLDDFPAERLRAMPCTLAEGISFATAEPLRADLTKAGVSVEMREMRYPKNPAPRT